MRAGLKGNAVVQQAEALMHPTSKRPSVKHRYFHARFYKFPSYLRRVAIMDAVGQVRSFHTRYNAWLDGDRRSPMSKPPRLTCGTSSGTGSGDGGQVVLGVHGPDVLAEVLPLRDDGFPDNDVVHGCAIFLIEPGLSPVVDIEGIAKIFQLTPSESAVAGVLVNGLTIPETAESRNTSPETIRSQLKAIFSKTGANSQLQLLRLAAKASPPIQKEP